MNLASYVYCWTDGEESTRLEWWLTEPDASHGACSTFTVLLLARVIKLNLAFLCGIYEILPFFLNHTIPTILRHIAPLNGLRVHLVESIVHFKRFRLSLVTRHFAQELEDVDNELFCFCHANHEWRLCGWVRIEVFISSLGRLDRCSWTYLKFLTFVTSLFDSMKLCDWLKYSVVKLCNRP